MMYSGDEDFGDDITSGVDKPDNEEIQAIADLLEREAERGCSNPGGHEWTYTGTAYGGDDPRWCGEGRCYCVHCGADGDA